MDRRSSASRAIHRGLFQMGGSAREERKAKVKPRYYYMPLLLGVFTPPGAVLWLEMYGPKHPLSPPFYFFDFFAVLALIPFLVLIGATKIISAVLTQPERTECIFWGGLLGATTLTAYGHANGVVAALLRRSHVIDSGGRVLVHTVLRHRRYDSWNAYWRFDFSGDWTMARLKPPKRGTSS